MTPDDLDRAFAQLELARRRRELLFWTLRGWFAIALLLGLTVAALVMLVRGRAEQAQLLVGAGGLAAASGVILSRRR